MVSEKLKPNQERESNYLCNGEENSNWTEKKKKKKKKKERSAYIYIFDFS